MRKFIAQVGLNYQVKGEEVRVEAGEEVTGLSAKQINELIELGDVVAQETEE